jgi:CRP-like cAMP-binding protein
MKIKGECFGEISYLLGVEATASVIAEEDTDLYILDTSYLSSEFDKDGALAARFFICICRLLSARYKSPSFNSQSDPLQIEEITSHICNRQC